MLIRILLIALAATGLAQTDSLAAIGLSALPLAILLGIGYGNLARPEFTERDATVMTFCQQKLLRLGIILFGFNLSFQQIASVGYQVILIDMLIIAIVLSLGILVGIRLFKLPREIAVLTSVGSAICGAAAVMATEPVVRARERDVTVAVATVVVFGTLAMFSYPVIYGLVGNDPALFGIYIGSTVHEVAQAVAAGQSIGVEAMQNAVVAKLIRVMMLAPVVIALGSLLFRQTVEAGQRRPIPVPWFVFGFIVAAAFNSLVTLPGWLLSGLQMASQLSLAIAMAALGIKTRWSAIRQAGPRPLALSLVLFVVLMVGGYGLNLLFYG